MFRTDLESPSPLSRHLTYPSEAPNQQEGVGAERTNSLFERVKNSLNVISTRLKSALTSLERKNSRNSLFGRRNVIVASENRGKISDAASYTQFSRTPVQLNQAGRNVARSNGFLYGQTEQVNLSPQLSGRGKCYGGSTHFISDYLEGGDIRQTARKFEGGIPMEGVLLHEIYNTALWTASMAEGEFEDAIGKIEKGEFNPQEYAHLSEENQHILGELHGWVSEGGAIGDENFWEFIDRIQGEISPEGLSNLKKAIQTPGLGPQDQGIARLSGVEIEWSSGSKGPQEILDTVSHLQPGAYRLSFPVTDSRGNITGTHATSLIIEEGGQSYLYDPNHGVGLAPNPTETVGRMFKDYTGYNTGKLGRIGNLFMGRANPSAQASSSGFSLAKYRKIQQL